MLIIEKVGGEFDSVLTIRRRAEAIFAYDRSYSPVAVFDGPRGTTTFQL